MVSRYFRAFSAAVLLLFCSSCAFLIESQSVKYIRYTTKDRDTAKALALRFNVAVEELYELNNFNHNKPMRGGQILRIPYHGQKLRPEDQAAISKNLVVKPVAQEKSVKTVKLSTARKYIGKLNWPVKEQGKITSRFGRRWFSFHEGIDIADDEGTDVVAAHAGQVVYSGSGLRGYGNLVVVKTDGLLTVYGHNKKNLVKVGENVRAGEHIADLGSTGKSSGPHLHFETRIKSEDNKNVAVDPMAFYP